MDVDCPIVSLKRSSSAPMINEISSVTMSVTTPSTSSSRDAVSGYNIFANSPRLRRFSTSSPGNVPRLTPRVNQLRQEECVDVAGREAAHEKEIHSAMQISQSWEDLTLEAEGLSFKDSESPTQQLNKMERPKRPLDPLSLNLSITGPPMCSSLSPTRSGFSQRQCYSPSMHIWKSNLSPSPTRKAFATRRSLSPIAIRPSCLGPVKRKFEIDEAGMDHNLQPPVKRTSGLLTSVASRLDALSSPLPGTISSVGTPESLSSADSPSFSFRPVDSPSPKMVDIKSNSPIIGENDSHYESRIRANSSGTVASTPSSSSDYMTGEADDSSDSKGTIPFSLKSVETMLSLSKDASQEDLQEMVRKCKLMVLESAECSDERKWLVRRLIELRLRAQELRETSDENLFETRVILGHHFVPQKYYITTSGPIYCDHCSGAIWTMLQSWYMCNDCKFSCHWKCLNNVCRVCVHVVASEAGGYTHTKDICPEQGLSKQNYRCAECKVRITFKSMWIEPRLCDYSGLYYCQRCHWNTVMVIPARVIRNWDMEPRLVSRAAAQLLILLEDRSVLPLEELNPKLFTLVPDLSLVKRMRGEMQMMKRYLVLCEEACTQGLPWKIGIRTHMIENSGNYSVKDLIDLQSGILLDELRVAYDTMHSHITQQCELCKARGHLCEICGNDEIIYPWDASSIICQQCSAVHHRVCWSKRNHCCPRCTRLQKRRALQGQADGENCNTDDTAKDS